MSFCNFLTKAVSTTGIIAAGIIALPILGAVGAISVPGAIVAVGLGTAAAAADEFRGDKK